MTLSHFSKGLIRPVSGVESVTTENTAPANYPPETGGTRSEATEGVDSSRLRLRHRLLCPPGTVIPGGHSRGEA